MKLRALEMLWGAITASAIKGIVPIYIISFIIRLSACDSKIDEAVVPAHKNIKQYKGKVPIEWSKKTKSFYEG